MDGVHAIGLPDCRKTVASRVAKPADRLTRTTCRLNIGDTQIRKSALRFQFDKKSAARYLRRNENSVSERTESEPARHARAGSLWPADAGGHRDQSPPTRRRVESGGGLSAIESGRRTR